MVERFQVLLPFSDLPFWKGFWNNSRYRHFNHTLVDYTPGIVRRVEALILAARGDQPYNNQYVTTYKLLHSFDGEKFLCYQEMAGVDKVTS